MQGGEIMKKVLIMFLVKLRWAYFHVSPSYIKFYVSNDSDEAHFQHVKNGSIHSNLVWGDAA